VRELGISRVRQQRSTPTLLIEATNGAGLEFVGQDETPARILAEAHRLSYPYPTNMVNGELTERGALSGRWIFRQGRVGFASWLRRRRHMDNRLPVMDTAAREAFPRLLP